MLKTHQKPMPKNKSKFALGEIVKVRRVRKDDFFNR